MINKIIICGFKCFEKVDLQIKNLNLFTGMNSSGKSSAIQAILLPFQAARDNNINILNGKLIKLGEFNDVKNFIIGSKNISIEIHIDNSEIICMSLYLDEENQLCLSISENANEILNKMDLIYLSADRVGVRDVYNKNIVDNERIGNHCEYAFSYLSENAQNKVLEDDFIKNDLDSGKAFSSQVDYWLEYILGYSIQAESIVDTDLVKVMFRKNNSTKKFRPKHVGTGVTYIASIIIAALSCRKNSIMIIENPEIHLHPKAQSKLIEFFAFLASNGIQVIIETHSDHIFNGIRKAIKHKEIKNSASQVYFFEQDKGGISNPININISEAGTIENQQSGLFDQFDDDLDDLLGL